MRRRIVFDPLAEDVIFELCDFIESKNTKGSGERFYVKLLLFIESFAHLSNFNFPLCNYSDFASRGWSCVVFQHKWVIAFTYNKSNVTVKRMILGSKLS